MKRNKNTLFWVLVGVLVFSLAACDRQKTVCTPEMETPKTPVQLADLLELKPAAGPAPTPVVVEIRGRMVQVDKLVDYPFCNDQWHGTVYVSCEAQVAEWDPEIGSRFLEGCQLDIEPNTVVYVAAHNDEPFYKGCSCHTGEVYEHNQ